MEAHLQKLLGLLFLVGLLSSPASAAQDQSRPRPLTEALSKAVGAPEPVCKSDDPKSVVVCGRSQRRFRIDPIVLEATRKAQAPPPKPLLDATTAQACTGPNCGGGTIPLVGMALTAAKAAVLASQGEDWREAFRTHPDEYQAYENSKAGKSGISIGVKVGNRQ